jgi:putative ABC transport system permease protein
MARRYFGDASPLGQRISFGEEVCEIVGVTADSKYIEIRETPPDTMYLSVFQTRHNASQFAIRTAIAPPAIVGEVRRQVRDVLKTVPVGKVLTLEEHVDASIVQERLVAMLSGLFGGLGALLAAIGLYGLLAYTVARRTNEIGIRMALGAQRHDVLRMVLRDALVMVTAGLVIGAPASLAAERLAGEKLDGWTIAFGVAAMLLTGLAAAWLPARRAARVDPMVALRWD